MPLKMFHDMHIALIIVFFFNGNHRRYHIYIYLHCTQTSGMTFNYFSGQIALILIKGFGTKNKQEPGARVIGS